MKYSISKDLSDFKEKLQPVSYDLYCNILRQLCLDHQDQPYSQDLLRFIANRDVKNMVDLADSLSAQKHADATQHFVANQLSMMILKYPHPGVENIFRPQDVAFKKFISSEHYCKRINQRLRAWRRREASTRPFNIQIDKMRSFIQYVIGHEPSLSQIWSHCNFGPGASIGVHGNATNFARKLLADKWSVTPSAFHYAYAALTFNAQTRELLAPGHYGFSSGIPGQELKRFEALVDIVKHNKITFVPKTVKTLRSIAVEPLLNGFLQKGTDTVLRGCLRRIGIDLSDQEPNRQMARQGSLGGGNAFSTIDLSSASDSISIELCKEVLPVEWYAFLNAIRSKEFESSLGRKTYEKFCSMGNGFCFPLETLLFTAACHAVGCTRPGVSYRVYGDDIIVPAKFFEPLLDLLSFLGFKVNAKKTFNTGPFRESCGADWFDGEDVRPYILDFPLDSLESLNKFLNLTRRSSRTENFFKGIRSKVLRRIPLRLQFWRPFKGNPDSGIDSTGDEHLLCRSCKWSKRLFTWRWKELSILPVRDNGWRRGRESDDTALLYAALSGSASAMPFTMRNITRTNVRFVSHGGATSTWLPQPVYR